MNEIELNVFTCCDDNYMDFIPLFVVSNLYHVENCFVEVGIKTNNYDFINNTKALLNKIYPNKFLIYKLNRDYDCITSSIRFISEPIIKSKYVYISDIDIVTLDSDILKCHLDIMKEHNLPYSNIIRDNTQRLTGLHFTPYENYYPIQEYDDLSHWLRVDEIFLYHLIKKRFPNLENTNKIRPVHGIHMSPNRDPHDTKLGWSLKTNWKKHGWNNLINSYEFSIIQNSLSDRIKKGIDIINKVYDNWSD